MHGRGHKNGWMRDGSNTKAAFGTGKLCAQRVSVSQNALNALAFPARHIIAKSGFCRIWREPLCRCQKQQYTATNHDGARQKSSWYLRPVATMKLTVRRKWGPYCGATKPKQ